MESYASDSISASRPELTAPVRPLICPPAGFFFCAYRYEFYRYDQPDILFEAFSAYRPVGLFKGEVKGEVLIKVLKTKDVYEFCFRSGTTVSMCRGRQNTSSRLPRSWHVRRSAYRHF